MFFGILIICITRIVQVNANLRVGWENIGVINLKWPYGVQNSHLFGKSHTLAIGNMLFYQIKQFLTLLNLALTSNLKMAAKTDYFRIIHILTNIWIKNIFKILRYMLFDPINTIWILLNWLDNVSQYGEQKL